MAKLVKVGNTWLNMDQVTMVREKLEEDQNPDIGPVERIPTLRVWFTGGEDDSTSFQKTAADDLRRYLDDESTDIAGYHTLPVEE